MQWTVESMQWTAAAFCVSFFGPEPMEPAQTPGASMQLRAWWLDVQCARATGARMGKSSCNISESRALMLKGGTWTGTAVPFAVFLEMHANRGLNGGERL